MYIGAVAIVRIIQHYITKADVHRGGSPKENRFAVFISVSYFRLVLRQFGYLLIKQLYKKGEFQRNMCPGKCLFLMGGVRFSQKAKQPPPTMQRVIANLGGCPKNHSRHLHAPLHACFDPNSVDVDPLRLLHSNQNSHKVGCWTSSGRPFSTDRSGA